MCTTYATKPVDLILQSPTRPNILPCNSTLSQLPHEQTTQETLDTSKSQNKRQHPHKTATKRYNTQNKPGKSQLHHTMPENSATGFKLLTGQHHIVVAC